MHIHEFARFYETRADEELLRLAEDLTQLTAEAHVALTGELAKRRISVTEHATLSEKTGTRQVEQLDSMRTIPVEPQRIGEFLAEVLRLYLREFWPFVRLVAPAMVLGYFAIVLSRQEAREILRHFAHTSAIYLRPTELWLEIWFLNLAGYFVSWIAFCFSFGTICSTVRQIEKGVAPSIPKAISKVYGRGWSFVWLAVVLFLLNLALVFGAMLLLACVEWLSNELHVSLQGLPLLLVTFATVGLAFLVLSRFALAVPAIVLDDCRVSQAIFRSDELTEGKWLTLAALLSKSLMGGYIAGLLPFWLAERFLGNVPLPSWFPWVLTAFSIAAAIIVEPPMFIGFALLYRRASPATPQQWRASTQEHG